MEKLKGYLKEIIVFILLLIVITNVVSYFKSSDLNKKDLILDKVVLIGDDKFIYDDSKPLLLHFWGSWCPVCKVEAPNIQNLSKDHQVLTIAVNSGSNNDIKKYLLDNGYDFKVVNDHRGRFSDKFNISVYPTTFIYDKNKKLRFSEVGYTSIIGLKLRMFWASL